METARGGTCQPGLAPSVPCPTWFAPEKSNCRSRSGSSPHLLMACSYHLCIFSCNILLPVAQRKHGRGLERMRSFPMAAVPEPCVHAACSPVNCGKLWDAHKRSLPDRRQQSNEGKRAVHRETRLRTSGKKPPIENTNKPASRCKFLATAPSHPSVRAAHPSWVLSRTG